MSVESTVILMDNSEYQRNGDYSLTRLSAQKDCIKLVCQAKLISHPENNVALLTISDKVEVLATLTSDIGRIDSKLQSVKPKGNINLLTGIKIGHLVLRHRRDMNHKMRLLAFIGSPLNNEADELIALAKQLKKEKVNIDFVLFGENSKNVQLMTTFLDTVNGKDGNSSHLLCVNRGANLSDSILSSPILQGVVEQGIDAFQFAFDSSDPELEFALRLSLEEENERMFAEHSKPTTAVAMETDEDTLKDEDMDIETD